MATHELDTQFFEPVAQPRTPDAAETAASPNEIYIPAPVAPRRRLRVSRQGWLLSGLLLLSLLLLTAVLIPAFLFFQSDRLLPGTQTLGVDVGLLPRAAAMARLNDAWATQTVTLTAGDHHWEAAPADLGLQLDAAATVAQAHALARRSEGWQRLLQNGGYLPVDPVWLLDTAVAADYLRAQAAALSVPPQDAQVVIVNGRAQEEPAQPGLAVDAEATLAQLAAGDLNLLANGELQLATTPLPATVTDVSAAVAQANELLQTAVSVRGYDPVTDEALTWVLNPDIWGQWLALDVTDPTQFSWSLDADKAAGFFNARMDGLGDGRYLDAAAAVTAVADAITAGETAVTLRIQHPDRTHTVQAGETIAGIGRAYGIPYPWIQQANPDLGDGLSVGQTITIPSPDVMLPLPVVPHKRIIVSISQQKAWVYENGQLKWEWLASTGISSSPTAPGVFQIQTHEANAYAGNWNLWMPHFMGIYRPVPTSDFMNGFHGFPTRDGANLLWTNNLGAPVTYGCILLSNENAAQLYNWAEAGVVVEIQP